MRIGIIGGGVVGRATARAFIEHVDDVLVYDVVKERSTRPFADVLGCDLIFVCLPTPMAGDGSCDVSAVEKFFACMAGVRTWAAGNFVLRSTVPIGTTRRLAEQYGFPNLIHSPEFLTARCSITDAQLPARNIIGTPGGAASECDGALQRLYAQRFPGVPIHLMTSDESEAVKLFQNSFFAVKVAFWNECRQLADALDMDWERIMEAVLADGRIAHSHTKVPGPDGKRGFGGTCLPKDLSNLVRCLERSTVAPWVTSAARARNTLDRKGEQ